MKNIFLTFSFIITILSAQSAKYWIATNGQYSNTGTYTFPFTFSRAIEIINPDDTIVVKSGTYNETSGIHVLITRSGTVGHPIVFMSEIKGGAVMNGNTNSSNGAFYISNQSGYINIEGFEIMGYADFGIGTYQHVHHITIRNNYIHDIGRYCTDNDGGIVGVGINIYNSYVLIENNVIHDIGRFAAGENGCSNSNENYKTQDHGLYIDGASHVTIQNNIFYAIRGGWGIHFYSGKGVASDDVKVVNNTFYDGQNFYNGQIVLWNSMSNTLIANNIIRDQYGAGINVYQGSYVYTNVLITKNLVSGGTGTVLYGGAVGVTEVNNYANTNPLFVNEENHDFTLNQTSPAINLGYPTGLTKDFAGNDRDKNMDIGAFEYIAVSTPPVANFSGTSSTVFLGGSVSFTDLSTNSPISWLWSFQGGTPSTSNVQNPTNIVYNVAGTYDVSLTATNVNESKTEIKTGYIKVNAAAGSIYYVSTAGSNSNSGSESHPFLTAAYAASFAKPGDIVIFEDGIYAGAPKNYLAKLSKSGTSSAYITFKARNKGGAILDGQNNSAIGAFYITGSYITISGFEIRGFSSSAIDVYAPSIYTTFSDLNIHDIGRYCIPDSDDNGRDAFYISQAQNVTIERCLIHDIGRFSPSEGCPTSMIGYQVLDHGVYVNGVTNITIRYNVFYNMQRGSAAQTYSGENRTTTGFNFINNTCENGNPYQQWGHVVLWGNTANALIANNIFKDHLAFAIRVYKGNYTYSNITISKNITSGGNGNTLLTDVTGIINTNNYNSTNPLFTNEATHDYSLQSTSPAINAGIDLGLKRDFLSNPIVGLPDIGAYEYINIENHPPSIQDQGFQLKENSPSGTEVGTIVASDPDAGQTLSYSIVSGNTNDAFAINALTGVLSVANSAALNLDFALVVKVQDNGVGELSSQATIAINIVFTGIELTGNNETIKVYPNPITDVLHIEINGNNVKTGFEIQNLSGQSVIKGNFSEKTVIQTINFSPGVYFLKLQTGKSFGFKKIIKG